jgi:hypothetical protein
MMVQRSDGNGGYMRLQHTKQLVLLSLFLNTPPFCASAQTEITTESSASVDELRIARPTYAPASHFNGLLPGYSMRWFRNLRQPSFCIMVLCHGTCAAPVRASYSPSNLGMPSPSASVPESITNSETPCGLKSFSGIITGASESECPMSQE